MTCNGSRRRIGFPIIRGAPKAHTGNLRQDTPLDVSQVRQNRLLATLPEDSIAELLSLGTEEALEAGAMLADFDSPIEAVYFPISGVVAMMAGADGDSIEVASIGREGMAGFPVVADTDRGAMRCVVRESGTAIRIGAAEFRERLAADDLLRAMLRRYWLAMMTHLAQSVICNRIHRIPARCARWLLMAHDRASGPNLSVTQEYVGQLLGVRRASVTVAAGALQKAGAIRYTRGRIRVLDREILEREACSCYRIIQDEYDRLLPPLESGALATAAD